MRICTEARSLPKAENTADVVECPNSGETGTIHDSRPSRERVPHSLCSSGDAPRRGNSMIGRCFRVFAAATVVVLALVLFTGHASQPYRAEVNAVFVANGTLPQVRRGRQRERRRERPECEPGGAARRWGGDGVDEVERGACGEQQRVADPPLRAGLERGPSTRSTAAWQQVAMNHAILVGTRGGCTGT